MHANTESTELTGLAEANALAQPTVSITSENQPSIFSSAISSIRERLNIFSGEGKQRTHEVKELVEVMGSMTDVFTKSQTENIAKVELLSNQLNTLQKAHEELKEKYSTLDVVPVQSSRPVATGGDGHAGFLNNF